MRLINPSPVIIVLQLDEHLLHGALAEPGFTCQPRRSGSSVGEVVEAHVATQNKQHETLRRT
jgi:hypothetical protein